MILRPNFIPTTLYQPEAAAYLSAITAAAGAINTRSLQHLDKFVRDCKEAGVWDRLLEVAPLTGNSLGAALIKIKYASANAMVAANFVEGDYSESTGLLGNGATKYLDTGFNVNLLSVGCHFSSYHREDTTGASARFALGVDNGTNQYLYIGSSNPATSSQTSLGSSQIAVGGPLTKGFYYAERVTTTDLKMYRNDSQIASQAAAISFAPPSRNLFAFARNNNGAATEFLNTRLSFLSIGLNMTAQQRTDFFNIVQTLQTNLGRAV